MEEPPLYQIVDWNKLFENAASRKIEHCTYACIPNHWEEFSFGNVLSEPDGANIYGCWIQLILICSRHGRPREGWLTHNGKADGPRMSAVEMARNFHATTIQVFRMLQVLTRRDVGWIRLVEGEPEYSQNREEENVNPPLQSIHPPLQSIDLPPQSIRPPLQSIKVAGAQKTDNKEVVNPPLQSIHPPLQSIHPPLQSTCTVLYDTVQYKEPENKTVPTATVLLSLSQNCEDKKKRDAQLAEDKLWLNQLFANNYPWTYEEEYLLSELSPIPSELKRLIDWAFKLPKDSPLHELTKLKQKRVTLMRELGGEGDKLRMIRKQMGYSEIIGGKK